METLELGLGLAGDGGPRLQPWQAVANILGVDRLAHWDATATGSIALSGAAVTGWTELVGGSVVAPGGATTRPIYSAAGFNSKTAAIIFDGVDDYLRVEQAPWFTGSTTGEAWALIRQDTLGSTAGDKLIYSTGANSLSSGERNLIRTPIGGINRVYISVDAAFVTLTTVDFSGYKIARVQYGATQSSLSVDNSSPVNLSVAPVTGTTRAVIGAAPSLASAFEAMALSTIIFTKPLSADKATALRTHLQSRY